ncbi:MAG: ATP-binding cassette domain-containing protein [Ruminococcaceae bacterium]|jgi:predicted ATPase|nr:ATP-binding cassette domain-containing protein [Oscillospiraceae bacterium]
MYKRYLRSLTLPSGPEEIGFLSLERRTCFTTFYPFGLFPDKGLAHLDFGPITILYGGNGSGKSTLLNILAEKLRAARQTAWNGSAFFQPYVDMCEADCARLPRGSRIVGSDDVFDYMLSVRTLNEGIDARREQLFEDYTTRKYAHRQLSGLDEYDDWKESMDARRVSQSQYVRDRLMQNVALRSNGESAIRFFMERIGENALYLLDEPENSLSVALQLELSRFLSDSARHFGCQLVIATHSPVLLAMQDALIYDLDAHPVATRDWTQLENVRLLRGFFEEHRAEFA